MLWRANLYVDERRNEDGSWRLAETEWAEEANNTWEDLSEDAKAYIKTLDWNDRNPWENTADHPNTWAQAGTIVPGGQIDIKPWTRPYDAESKFTNAQTNVYDAVAYSLGCVDSPLDFNADMEDQRKAIEFHREIEWKTTLAPDDDWLNYVDYKYDKEEVNGEEVPITVNQDCPPYRPVFRSLALRSKTTPYKGREYPGNVHTYTAGLDCLGFVKQSAIYSGNNYAISPQRTARLLWEHEGQQYGMYKFDTSKAFDAIDKSAINLLVPGDIVFYSQPHWLIINKIVHLEGVRELDPDKTSIIEVVQRNDDLGGWIWKAVNIRFLSEVPANAVLYRLRIDDRSNE